MCHEITLKNFFLKKSEKIIAKKFARLNINDYLCTAFKRKCFGTIDRKGSLGEWLKPAVC